MIAIGMDVHSSLITAYAVAESNEDIEEVEFANEFNRKFRTLTSDRHGLCPVAGELSNREHCILIENSTKTHEIFWILIDLGCNVVVAHATDLFRITKSVKKTDRHDCMELAHYMRRKILGEEEFKTCLIVDEKWMNRRQICRIYIDESEGLSDLRRQIKSFMLLRGIKIEKATKDIVSKSNLKKLDMTDNATFALLVDKAKITKERLVRCEKSIMNEFKDDENYNLLLSIPGFGTITSAYVASMIIDIRRFKTDKHFAAYTGLIPKMRESGDSAKFCGITRRGDSKLRNVILQSTFIHITNDKDRLSSVSRKYDNLRSRGFPHKKALTAASNKMTKIIYTVLSKRERYRNN